MDQARLPLIPLVDTVVFPGTSVPLSLHRPRSLAAAAAGSEVIVVTQRDSSISEPELKDLYRVGVRGRISAGQSECRLEAVQRVKLLFLHPGADYLEASYENLSDPNGTLDPETEAVRRLLLDELAAFLTSSHLAGINLARLQEPAFPGQLYWLALQLNLPWESRQKILQNQSVRDCLDLLRVHLKYEVQVRDLKKNLTDQASQDLDKVKRETLLRQELANIQRELGEDPNDLLPLRETLDHLSLPGQARQEALRQLHQLEKMQPASSEYAVGRSYLELLVDLPWNVFTQDVLDLPAARLVLDEDHFGLQSVKERILEFLAVMKLNPQAHAPILCFVGPPGTGKTSLGMSIARALGRKFERLSLGGMHDEGELRGHRRTYVGAMTGRVIQALRRAKVCNPLLMLDEVDKLNRSFEGDPAAALLEVLDPAQNHEFHDNYLDLPFDLSKVFFITTANTLEGIPAPLLDRMEVIRLAGYSPEEKVEIARRHLLPKQLLETGLSDRNLSVPVETLDAIITQYTREAGVRGLQRQLARMLRRLALRLSEGGTLPEQIDAQEAFRILGNEGRVQTEVRSKLGVGVAAGLAYTELGGEVIYIEASCLPQGEGLSLTGHLGEIMKESAQAAYSFIRSQPEKPDQRVPPMHLHVPAGATPKDGPSAGLAMVCAMTSALDGKALRPDTAMTGEITLCGLVLPVGGLKEKILAAHRFGIKRMLLPKANANSLEDLPTKVRDELEFVLVESIDQALAQVFTPVVESLSST
ncbi:endopeptidase La [bacterium]|nr:endopeptidase La [bacterium]